MFDDADAQPALHAGAPVARYPDGRARLLFVIEGRLFFDELDNIDNNYQFWGGLRYVSDKTKSDAAAPGCPGREDIAGPPRHPSVSVVRLPPCGRSQHSREETPWP